MFELIRKMSRASLVLALLTIAGLPGALAQASDKLVSHEINIPAGSLANALDKLIDQAGVQIMYETNLTEGIRVGAVSGALTFEAALARLLANTGLRADSVDARTVVLKRVTSSMSDAAAEQMRVAKAGEGAPSADEDEKSSAKEEYPSSSEGIQEVIVTATKRAERVQDVPLSISVVTADDIDRRGLINAEDYLRGVPGANHVDSANGQSIVIRGMETAPLNQNFTAGATTATYFGETPTTSSAGLGSGTNIDLKLVDIERIEILRGPQGTAFGNSSLGGAVRTIPVAPKLARLEGKVAAGYSSTARLGGDNFNAQAIGNLPISEKLAIRAAGYQYEESGIYRNRARSDANFQATAVIPFGAQASAADQDDVGSYSAIGGRIAALFQATDDLRLTLSYLSQDTEMDGMPVSNIGGYEQAMFQVAQEHVVRGRREGVSDSDIEIINATLDYNLDWASVVATYSDTTSASTLTQPWQLYGQPWAASFYADSDHREHVGEIRLVTQLSGPWNFLAGFYTEKLKDEVLFDYRWFGDPAANFFNFGQRLIGTQFNDWELKQKAAFGEVSWEFIPRLTLVAGVRAYDYERRTRDAYPTDYFFAPLPPGTTTTTASDESGTNFRANLSYKPTEEALLYAGWSQGFRLGKPQAALSSCDADSNGIVDGTTISIDSTREVKSDGVDSYEIGGKFTLLDRRVTIDTALFRMDWSDIPVRAIAGSLTTGCGLLYVTNAGGAKSEGVELQMSFQVTEPLRIDLGGSWIRAQLTEDVPNVPPRGVFSGERLPGSPKVNANLGVQYDFHLGRYQAFVRADSTYVGQFYDDILQSPALRSGDYLKLDASARVSIRNLNIDLFVRNLANEDAYTFRGAFVGTTDSFGYRLRPRTFGVQLAYRFGL